MHSREHIRFLLHEAKWPLKKNVPTGDEKHAQGPPEVRKRERDLKHQCWGVLRERDRYLSVISSGTYSLAHWLVLKILEELNSMYELCDSQKYTKQLKNCRFFQETRWFLFNVFRKNQNQWLFDSVLKKGNGTGGSLQDNPYLTVWMHILQSHINVNSALHTPNPLCTCPSILYKG
jgi:hypothetical protein